MKSSLLLNIGTMFILPMLVVLLPIVAGQYYGIHRKKKGINMEPGSVGTVVGTTLALLAFMLAFTFQIVANRYDTRKELLLNEVTEIRTIYLRAGLLPEPFNSGTKELLAEYTDIRIHSMEDTSKLKAGIVRSHQILDQLWNFAEELAAQDRSSEVYALYTQSLNDLIANFNQRLTMVYEYRIPKIIMWVLITITIFSMLSLGYQFGISGKGSFRINILLSIIFAVVMFLILALDRPEKGLSTISQKPVHTLQKQLQVWEQNK